MPGWSIWEGPWHGGETAEQVAARADRVIARVLDEPAGSRVVLVAHGHILRVLGARWIGGRGRRRPVAGSRHGGHLRARLGARLPGPAPVEHGGRRDDAGVSTGERVETVCYRHPDRIAGAVCRRCHRPICPECIREAPVGWQCATCVHADSRRAPVTRWRPRPTAALGQSRVTPVVAAIILVNVVVYLATANRQANIDFRFAMIPAYVADGQWYRLFTAAFLHASVSHIFFNMFTLAIIGPAVETSIGRLRFGALYLLAALGGSVASYLLGPFTTEAVGASGAIFGVMGAYFVLARRSGGDTRTVLALIGINLVIGFASPASTGGPTSAAWWSVRWWPTASPALRTCAARAPASASWRRWRSPPWCSPGSPCCRPATSTSERHAARRAVPRQQKSQGLLSWPMLDRR